MVSILKKWEYLSNKMVFCFKFFINFHYLVRPSIGRISMKIAFVVFVYELINYL